MKKTLLTLFFAVSALMLRADNHSETMLKKMADTFNAYNSYSVEFSATMSGEFENLGGSLIVSGEKYYLDVYDSEIFFDGKNGYTYSESNQEVIIETPDPNDNRLFANPAKIFQVYGNEFNSHYKGSTTLKGKKAEIIELEPKKADTGYNKITVYTYESGYPGKLVYQMSEYEKDLVMEVIRITPNIKTTDDMFRFDPKTHPGVEVIDFR